VAMSLGLYLAERNKGEFNNHFITFSQSPELQEVIGDTLGEKLANMSQAKWGYSTNLKSVFQLILNTAVSKRLSQDDMPSKLFIVSDMEFDRGVVGTKTLFAEMEEEYALEGYSLPEVIFWNVDSRNTQFPVTMHQTGTSLVSGFSPSIFKNLLAGKDMTPYSMMLEVLNGERYSAVRLPEGGR
jgi:hypothetical protein